MLSACFGRPKICPSRYLRQSGDISFSIDWSSFINVDGSYPFNSKENLDVPYFIAMHFAPIDDPAEDALLRKRDSVEIPEKIACGMTSTRKGKIIVRMVFLPLRDRVSSPGEIKSSRPARQVDFEGNSTFGQAWLKQVQSQSK